MNYGYGQLPTLYSTVSFLKSVTSKKAQTLEDKQRLAEKKLFSVYDVQFCPYTPSNVTPIFAAVGHVHTIICRPSPTSSEGVKIIRWFKDQDPEAALNSVTWACDPKTRHPLVCVAGAKSILKVLDVKTGRLVHTLSGHGGAIQDLITHPLDPEVIVSASEDYTARIWHLGSAYRRQPCAALFAGPDGHKQSLLSIAFHRTGRWLLTAGMDSSIHMVRLSLLVLLT